jgi:uncharacterized protein (TIGR02217 family)
MSNAVFPVLPGLEWGVMKVPTFATQVIRSLTGREVRGSLQQYPVWEYTLKYEFLKGGNLGSDLNSLMAFFVARQGQFDSFLYSDPADSSVTAQSIGTGNGTATTFQLVRTLSGGGAAFVEPVNNPNVITGIYVAGVLQTGYSVSATGLVTLASAPANGVAVTWTGTFYYRVRFLQDSADFTAFYNNLWELKALKFRGSPGNLV